MKINSKNQLKKVLKKLKKGKLVVFGIVPTYAATGYGYIKSKDGLKNNEVVSRKVEKFIEKPNLKTAELLFAERKYTWNSGMFVFKAKFLKRPKIFSPEMVQNCKKCLSQSTVDLDFLRLEKSSFSQCRDISIDVAVFEKTEKAFVLPLECGWDDIGSWDSLWNIAKKKF